MKKNKENSSVLLDWRPSRKAENKKRAIKLYCVPPSTPSANLIAIVNNDLYKLNRVYVNEHRENKERRLIQLNKIKTYGYCHGGEKYERIRRENNGRQILNGSVAFKFLFSRTIFAKKCLETPSPPPPRFWRKWKVTKLLFHMNENHIFLVFGKCSTLQTPRGCHKYISFEQNKHFPFRITMNIISIYLYTTIATLEHPHAT